MLIYSRALAVYLVASGLPLLAQPSIRYFTPSGDCAPTPQLFKDAAKSAGIDERILCYITDRADFARKAGESFAREVDRVGKMVRVVIPFGHLLVLNGTELAVVMAVRRYKAEDELRTKVAALPSDEYFFSCGEAADLAAAKMRELRRVYANELLQYKPTTSH